MQRIVEVDGLCFGYSGHTVLYDIGFHIDAGEMVGLVGSNGAGKSTLLKLLLAELAPDSGTIALFGQPVQQFTGWPRIGYVPQNGAALASGFPASALEIVLSNLYHNIGPLRPAGKRYREQAMTALASVGMQDHARSLIGELSGGQLQRVLLARAMVAEPELLLLDEPTTGVDAQTAEELYQSLEALSGRGITVVMVTHDLDRAAPYLQRALCLEHTSLVALDRDQVWHELEHRHKHPH